MQCRSVYEAEYHTSYSRICQASCSDGSPTFWTYHVSFAPHSSQNLLTRGVLAPQCRQNFVGILGLPVRSVTGLVSSSAGGSKLERSAGAGCHTMYWDDVSNAPMKSARLATEHSMLTVLGAV